MPDPRTARTKARVLAAARAIMAEQGAYAVTFAEVGKRAGVSRQTLYNHWPSREQLIVDLVLADGGFERPAQETGSARDAVLDYLRQLVGNLTDPATRAAVLAVLQTAEYDAGSRQALDQLLGSGHRALNERLAGLREPVDADTFARAVGPVFFQLFFLDAAPDEGFLHGVADSVLGAA